MIIASCLTKSIPIFQERAVDMQDYATIRRIKLEQCAQLATFQTDATQVIDDYQLMRH